MRQTPDRPHDRRRVLLLSATTAPQDRVLGLTALALTAMLALSVVRCSSAAVSTVDSELRASTGELTTLRGRAPAVGDAARILRPRPVRPSGPSRGSGDEAAGTVPTDSPPLTFAAPPRQGTPAATDAGADAAPADPAADGAAAAPADGGSTDAAGTVPRLQARLTELTNATGGWFSPDGTSVTAEARPVLDQVSAVLGQLPDARVEIGGHTDTNGSAEANQRLSQARADAVRDELVRRGVDADRLVAVGHGQNRPRNPNDTVAGRAANRRIELTVLA